MARSRAAETNSVGGTDTHTPSCADLGLAFKLAKSKDLFLGLISLSNFDFGKHP